MKRARRFIEERDECSRCGKTVGTYIPKGGNGGQRNAYPHKTVWATKEDPIGRYIRCPGSRLATRNWGNGVT